MASVSETSSWSAGQIIDNRFRVIGCLGEGGMGVVLQAWHEELRKPIAIKLLRQRGSLSRVAAERFLREARSAARLQSEHTVRIFDAKTLADGTPYIVMEHLQGVDLSQLLKRQGPLSPATAVDYTVQSLVAIAEAHAVGLVHRDLKPSNLFLTQRSDGASLIKVLDFGLAKAVFNDDEDPALTITNEIVGSPAYMSPEQLCDSKSADQQSDVWALGVLLYQLLTGRMPFEQASRTQLTGAILTMPPVPLRTMMPELPKALEKVIMACLEKDKGKRHADVAALALGLRAFAPPSCQPLIEQIVRTVRASQGSRSQPAEDGKGVAAADACAETVIQGKGAKRAPRSRAQRSLWLLAGVVIVVCVLAGTWALQRSPHERVQSPDPALSQSGDPVRAMPRLQTSRADEFGLSSQPAAPKPAPKAKVKGNSLRPVRVPQNEVTVKAPAQVPAPQQREVPREEPAAAAPAASPIESRF